MQPLTFAQLQSITLGALALRETPEGIRFDRLTAAQIEAFRQQDARLAVKCSATAGVRLDFHTDGDLLALRFRDQQTTSHRTFGYFDVLVNGSMLLHSGTEDVSHHSDGSWCVSLPEGENHVQVYFPNLSSLAIESVALSDGASLRPYQPKRRILIHGDSISQGYDARFPSLSYTNRLGRYYDAEVLNQAIGSACFDRNVVARVTAENPDFILVAYGSNDWRFRNWASFCRGADEFFHTLTETYPGIPTFAVLPIWRADLHTGHPCAGDFMVCREKIAQLAQKYGCIVLDDFDLLPHDVRLFSDGELHPNDEGFFFYAQRLAELLDKYLPRS